MSDYSLATPFSNNLYNNSFLSVTARKPEEKAPIPLAFKNATLPKESNNPTADQSNLNAATTGTNKDFMNGALSDAGLATFSTQKPDSTPKAPEAGGQSTKEKSFASRFADNVVNNKSGFGLIGALIGALGSGDKKESEKTAPTAGKIGTLTGKAASTDDLNVVDEAPNTPSTPAGTGTVSMNTVDGKPEKPQGAAAGSGDVSFGNNPPPVGDKESHNAKTTSPDADASRNGDGGIDQGQAAKIQEQLDALNDPKKAQELLAQNKQGEAPAAGETPKAGQTPAAEKASEKKIDPALIAMAKKSEARAAYEDSLSDEDFDKYEKAQEEQRKAGSHKPTAQEAEDANNKVAQGSAARDQADGITGHNPNDPNAGSSGGGLFGS